MKKLITTSALFITLAMLPIACSEFCNNPCGCGPVFEVIDFRVQSFETLSLTTEGQQVSPSTSLPYDFITKSFRIKETQNVSYFEESNNSIPGVAFACSPPSPQSQEKMIGIQIINSKEVEFADGEIFKVGQDISDFFEVNYFFVEQTRPIPEFLENGLTLFREDLFKLVFTKNPGKEVQLEFSMRIMLEGGLEFNLQNEILSIR
ncbi:hypothetical protein OU792_11505 [Algoriphagus sp. NF]|uniref:Lipoprotein n=1 Tax=Algoriphagus marincola TaxID=264027 RepID=A0ABS7N232_9BACT|nr:MULTISPECIES: hypothetical protein [Algoriphagus]MBY5950372.1 hypothetical protein [Algoriphagus marincola]MDE0560617.1 hypothetical protein [Algoriphagus sp. NF]